MYTVWLLVALNLHSEVGDVFVLHQFTSKDQCVSVIAHLPEYKKRLECVGLELDAHVPHELAQDFTWRHVS